MYQIKVTGYNIMYILFYVPIFYMMSCFKKLMKFDLSFM
jgi:hypothetical protein